MQALENARKALEVEKAGRVERENALRERCVRVLATESIAKAAKWDRLAPRRASQSQTSNQKQEPQHVPLDQVTSALAAFYAKHNLERLGEEAKVAAHFDGRLDDLNTALQVQYGADLGSFLPKRLAPQHQASSPAPAADSAAEDIRKEAGRAQKRFYEAAREFHLPGSLFTYRSGSGKSIAGVKDLWLELLQGELRFDSCVREEHGGRKPYVELSLSTHRPAKVRCALEGLKLVDGISPSEKDTAGLGTVYAMENVSVQCEIDFNFAFTFDGTRWRHSDSFRFELLKLKTNRMLVDQVLKQVVNVAVPSLVRKSLLKVLPVEFGAAMLHPSVVAGNRTKPMGAAVLFEVSLHGWPTSCAFSVDLMKAISSKSSEDGKAAASVLRELKLSEAQLHTLQQLNSMYKKERGSLGKAFASLAGKNEKEAWKKGVFPLNSVSLLELVALGKGLYVSDLVAAPKEQEEDMTSGEDDLSVFYTDDEEEADFTESEASEFGGTADNASEASTEGTDGGDPKEAFGVPIEASQADTGAKDIAVQLQGQHDEEGDENEVEEDDEYLSDGADTYVNDQALFQVQDDSEIFSNEYAVVIACASRAQAEAQRALDDICDRASTPRWSLARLVRRVESHVSRKQVSIQVQLHALDIRANADVIVEEIQKALWKTVKRMKPRVSPKFHAKQVGDLHAFSATSKIVLAGLRAMASNLKMTVTGAVTGGKTPAFEFSVKDLTTEGIVDMQLSNLRIGGLIQELMTWCTGFLRDLSVSKVSKTSHKESAAQLKSAKKTLMRHLELLQFFLDLSLEMQQDDRCLIAAVEAQKENPRPALSAHLNGALKDLVPRRAGGIYVSVALADGTVLPATDSGYRAADIVDRLSNAGVSPVLTSLVSAMLGTQDPSKSYNHTDALTIIGFAVVVARPDLNTS
mmetsp:Transcript_6656/g.12284  ORF Transcript_6656/g.12284 Transcript_6656/m.12284 type:complete len:917 (-) Transcript_6656:1481-4231(-)